MITKRVQLAFAGGLLGFFALGRAAVTEGLPDTFYLSMRGLTSEAEPSFVEIYRTSANGHTTPIAACDGHTYYASAAGAQAVAQARTAGEVVQLHAGYAGDLPEETAIRCILDAAGT